MKQLLWFSVLIFCSACSQAGPNTTVSEAVAPVTLSNTAPAKFSPDDWPWWRGPTRDGIAPGGQTLPTTWSDTNNILWQTPVPGKGHGSATVVGDKVFLAAAEAKEELQSVICYDRNSGKQLWKEVIHTGNFVKKGNKKSTSASSTVACDGERIFINFINNNAVYTTALSLEGKQLWQKKITDYVVHQGYGSSPAIYGPLVIVSADNKGGGAIVGLDRATGDVVWRNSRPEKPNYPSPIILTAAGQEQLFMTGCNLVSSFEPLTGKTRWEVEGATTECVTSTVTDGKHIYTSGGYPDNHMAAVKADGSGEVVWRKTLRVYVPSMLVHEGYLYAVSDAGVATCWKSDTGKAAWKKRLGGTFSSSPVLAGENIYATNEAGTTFVFKANPDSYEEVGKNQLAGEVYSTPTICGNKIYLRAANYDDAGRKEMLYCIGDKK